MYIYRGDSGNPLSEAVVTPTDHHLKARRRDRTRDLLFLTMKVFE